MILKADKLSLSLSRGKTTVFRDLSLELDAGELGNITGRAGSGKTLLGLALCGFLPLWAGSWNLTGTVELFGQRLQQGEYLPEIGIVLENPYSQVSGIKRTVREELAFPLECRGEEPSAMHGKIGRYAGSLGISHLLDRAVVSLSGGELQRVIIASAIISEPRFLFLDRLLTEIDTGSRPRIMELIASHAREFEGGVLVAEDPWLLPEQSVHRTITLTHEDSGDADPGNAVRDLSEIILPEAGREVLRTEAVSFAFGTGKRVLDNVSFALKRGEIAFVDGPNGAGKTTLAKIIAGILKPSSGEVIVAGEPTVHLAEWERMSLVGLALQNPGLHLSRRTVREELASAREHGAAPGELTEILGLDERLDHHPLELTQAEKKRLGIALACGAHRNIVILDEPSQYQDGEGFGRICTALEEIAGAGQGILIITHDPRFYAVFPRAAVIRLSPEGSG